MITVETINLVLNEFYATSDERRRQELHTYIREARKSPEILELCCSILQSQPSSSAISAFFAANTLHEIIVTDFKSLLDSSDKAVQLFQFLTTLLENLQGSLSEPWVYKLFSTVAALVIFSVPDIIEDPLKDLLNRWCSPDTNSNTSSMIPLLDILAEIPEELQRITTMPLSQKSTVKAYLDSGSHQVHDLCSAICYSFSSSQLNQDIASLSVLESCLKCTTAWSLDLRREPDFSKWAQLLLVPKNMVQMRPSQSISLLRKLSQKETLHKFPKFQHELFRHVHDAILVGMVMENPIFLEKRPVLLRESEGSQDDVDIFCGCAEVCIALCENSVDYLAQNLLTNASDKMFINYCEFLLALTSWPGVYGVDQDISGAPLNLLADLNDSLFTIYERTRIDSDEGAIEISQAYMSDLIKPFNQKLLPILISNIQFPSSSLELISDSEWMEEFQSYRDAIAETILSCRSAIGSTKIFQLLIDQISGSWDVNRSQKSLLTAELCIFVLRSLIEYLPPEEPSIGVLFHRILPGLKRDHLVGDGNSILNLLENQLACNALKLISDAAPILAFRDDGSELFINLSDYCYHSIPISPDLGLKALHKLFSEDSDKNELKLAKAHKAESIAKECLKYFENNSIERKTRLLALSCCGLALSFQKFESIENILVQFMDSRTGELMALCGGYSDDKKEKILFELAVFTTFLRAISGNELLNDVDGHNKSPVMFIVERELEVFHHVLVATKGDQAVVKEICASLTNAITSLLDRGDTFVEPCCRLLTEMPLGEPSMNFAKQLFLVFAQNTTHQSALGNLFSHWLLKIHQIISLVNQGWKEDRVGSGLEPFIDFVTHIIRKNWDFLRTLSWPELFNILFDISLAVLNRFKDQPSLLKTSALFLNTLIGKYDFDENLRAASGARVSALVASSFERICTEILPSSLDNLSDVLFTLNRYFPSETRKAIPANLAESTCYHSIGVLLREMSNKRKFREYSRRLNIEMRKHI